MHDTLANWPIEQIGVWGIYAFTLIMGVTLTLQITEVYTKKSVAALSTIWIVYFAAMFLSGVIYGATSQNLPLLINNLVLAGTHIVLVIAILRFRGFNGQEWLMAIGLMVALVLMTLSAHPDRWFMAFAPGGILAIFKQAWTIRVEARVGVISPWLLASYVLANLFWTMYALAGSDWTLHIICPANLVACSILFSTWIRYRNVSTVTA